MTIIPVWVSNRLPQMNQRRIEAEGFFAGAHKVKIAPGLEELDARFDRKIAEFEKTNIQKQKVLEAELNHANESLPALQGLGAAVHERVGDRLPNLVLPILIASIGIFALVAEALLLAPAMDVLNVTERWAQLITALGVSGVVGLSFHFAWESVTSDRFPRVWRILCRSVALMLGIGLVCWGRFRGLQVGYSATLSQNPLGDFLNGHPLLASLFYIFVTLSVPLMAATASHFSGTELHEWWEWSTTRRKLESLTKQIAVHMKKLEGLQESMARSRAALEHQKREWTAAYRHNFERGESHGAIKDPYWIVPLKATISALLIGGLFSVGLFALAPVLDLSSVVVVWLIAFLYYRRRWQSPTPVEYFDYEHVQFAKQGTDAAPTALLLNGHKKEVAQ